MNLPAPTGCPARDLSVRDGVADAVLAHLGDLIRRLSAPRERDSLQSCPEVTPTQIGAGRQRLDRYLRVGRTRAAMTIVAHAHSFVIGVDTHARNHSLSVLAATGEVIDSARFPTSSAGIARAISWAARRTGADQSALWVIEGVASYGAGLAAACEQAGYEIG